MCVVAQTTSTIWTASVDFPGFINVFSNYHFFPKCCVKCKNCFNYSPTEGGMTCVSTLTSMTANMMVLLCRLDKEPTIALAASWIKLWSGKSSGWKDWEPKQITETKIDTIAVKKT